MMTTTNDGTPRRQAAGWWPVAAIALGAVALLASSAAAEPKKDPPPATAGDWYAPKEADFRPEYDRDTANQAKESWQEYWSWVNKFYEGDFFTQGWTKQGKGLLEVVRSERTRDELRATLNDLGRRVAAEWSKDNGVRKIDTANLLQFGRQLQIARQRDDGSGSSIRAAVDKIRSQVDAKLGGR
jgi:hypothetical protein